MSSRGDYEGLQVNPEALDSEGLQLNTPSSDSEKIVSQMHETRPALPFGLQLWTFSLLIVVITALVVGGAVGGGLGGALANCNSNQNSQQQSITTSSSAPTTTSIDNPYTPVAPNQVKNLTLDCPKLGATKTAPSQDGYSFKWYCGTDNIPNRDAEEGGIIKDIAPIVAYTVEDCLRACVQTTLAESIGVGATCRSVVFYQALSYSLEQWAANCWLKNGTKTRDRPWLYEDINVVYIEVSRD